MRCVGGYVSALRRRGIAAALRLPAPRLSLERRRQAGSQPPAGAPPCQASHLRSPGAWRQLRAGVCLSALSRKKGPPGFREEWRGTEATGRRGSLCENGGSADSQSCSVLLPTQLQRQVGPVGPFSHYVFLSVEGHWAWK